MHAGVLVAAGVALVGAVIAFAFLPARAADVTLDGHDQQSGGLHPGAADGPVGDDAVPTGADLPVDPAVASTS
jgi:hypothetical protein